MELSDHLDDDPILTKRAFINANVIHPSLQNIQNIPSNDTGIEDIFINEDATAQSLFHKPFELGRPLRDIKAAILPALDNMSTQVLDTFTRGSQEDLVNIAMKTDEEPGKTYKILLDLFDKTKRLYSSAKFLNPDELGFNQLQQKSIVRKANLATFISSIYGCGSVGFFHLNEFFLDVFAPDGAKLLRSQAQLFLDLKTQAYISARSANEKDPSEVLDDLFPIDLGDQLKKRRSTLGSGRPATTETDFAGRCAARRKHLEEIDDEEKLKEEYKWDTFLKDIGQFIVRNQGSIISYTNRAARSISLKRDFKTDPTTLHFTPSPYSAQSTNIFESSDFKNSMNSKTGMTPSQQLTQKPFMSTSIFNDALDPEESGYINYDTNITPDLSKREAVEAVVAATTPLKQPRDMEARRLSSRRPWTNEERAALFAGLDAVGGPKWSEILQLYGPNGRISDVLKDRSQVQLKDKARNLKLFFLKHKFEVPIYLRNVTGELKEKPDRSSQ